MRFYIAIFYLLTLLGCSRKDDAYIDLVDKNNLIYLGKVDSVKVFPGHNRLKLSWILNADPSVSTVRIYWNNYKDSVEVPVADDKRRIRMEAIVNGLLEGKQSVFLVSFDELGNRSVPVEVLADVYGDRIIGGLLSRGIRNAELFDTNVKMEFLKSDTTITSTEVKYKDVNSVERVLVVMRGDTELQLPGFPAGGKFQYRSWFKLDTAAIDTLAAAWITTGAKENISALYLKNNKYPFEYAAYDGTRFGSLKDWLENKAALAKGPNKRTYGAYDAQYFGLSKTGSDTNIVNGKVYQTIDLPAGKYELVWTNSGGLPTPDNAGTQARFIAVAVGDSLPNTDKINATNALGFASFAGATTARAPFTLTEQKKVAVGIVVNWTTAPQSFKATEVRLLRVPD